MCCRPERHLVKLAPQVHKRDPKSALALQFERENGWVRFSATSDTLLTGAVARGASGHNRTHAGFVSSDNKEKLEWDRL
jgi:hypothetical protein